MALRPVSDPSFIDYYLWLAPQTARFPLQNNALASGSAACATDANCRGTPPNAAYFLSAFL
jgi:hypothetical protein